MERIVIFTGGSADMEFLKKQDVSGAYIICADHGLEIADQLGLIPDLLIGDFDSVDPVVLLRYQKKEGIKIIQVPPEKDDTDTELALHVAMERKPEEILIFGAFGTRMDHTLANIGLLKQAAEKGIKAVLCDAYNRVTMVQDLYHIHKKNLFGTFVSLLPFGGDAEHVTLKGFKYLLTDGKILSGSSLGISNELIHDEGVIQVGKGSLVVIESRD